MKVSRWLLSLILFSTSSLYAQLPDLIKIERDNTRFRQALNGKIFFTSKRSPVPMLDTTKTLTAYTLTNKSDLFFIAFMDNSLTNYMHNLAPGIGADSLVKVGNYQFSLLIDDRLIYQSNLLPGAPPAKMQDSATILNRPLIDNANGSGTWSESYWNRFLSRGGDSALTDGKHQLRMEIRAYVKTGTVIVGPLIAAGELPITVAREVKPDISTISMSKPAPYDGFALSTEKFDHKRMRELKGAIDEGLFKRISSVVVIKNGKLLIEEYFNGASRNTLHDTRSVGKSFSSTLTGIAIQDKYIRNEEQTLNDFYDLNTYANSSAEKQNTSLRELLTMSSGFDGNDENPSSPGNEENMYPTNDWVKFALDLPFSITKPAGEWHYFTAGVILLGDILNRQVKGGLEKYADEKLFKPLGIRDYKWQYTPQSVPNTAGGLQLNALDLAKYGQLYKNGGAWKGKQILPKDWVVKSFTRQKKITARQEEYYGYLFWNKTFLVGGKQYEAFYCAGNGGNYILVFRELPLVIVITATAYGQPYAHRQVAKMLTDYVLPSVIEK